MKNRPVIMSPPRVLRDVVESIATARGVTLARES